MSSLSKRSPRMNQTRAPSVKFDPLRDSMFRDPRVVLGLLALWALIVVVWAMVGD